MTGHLDEAKAEFEIAVKEAGGTFAEASRNLELCRSLLTRPARAGVVTLKLVATADVSIK